MNTKGRVCRTPSTYDCLSDCDFELSVLLLAIRLKMMTKKIHPRYVCYTAHFRGAHSGQDQTQCAKCASTLVMVLKKKMYVGFVSNKYGFMLRLGYLCITIP